MATPDFFAMAVRGISVCWLVLSVWLILLPDSFLRIVTAGRLDCGPRLALVFRILGVVNLFGAAQFLMHPPF